MAEIDPRESFDAAGILRMSRARYAELTSYRDSGEVEYRLRDIWADLPPEVRAFAPNLKDEPPNVIRFRSWFRRPRELRFEWITHHPYPPLRHLESFHAIWVGPAGAFARMSFDKATWSCSRGLEEAVAAATGVSMGSACHFATFFVSGYGIAAPLEQLPVEGVGEVEVEGVACWQVTTRQAVRTPESKASQEKTLSEEGWKPEEVAKFLVDRQRIQTLSIGKADLLVRRIQVGDHVETRRNIQANVDLPDDLFDNGPQAHLPFGS